MHETLAPHSPAHGPARYQDDLLDGHLQRLLGSVDAAERARLKSELQWVELQAGATLMTQGEPGDSLYLSISGRLRAYIRGDDDKERLVREMARGEVIGEMALYTDAPRSATVVAIRDSVLVRLSKPAFERLLGTSPALSVALTRQLIGRLQTVQTRSELARPVALALLPVSAGVDAPAFTAALAAQLAPQRVCIVDAARLDGALAEPGLAQADTDDAAANQRIALHLDELEAAHDFVLLVADAEASAWTERCTRRCDEMLLLADATQPPRLHASEERFLLQRRGRAEAAEWLVLLHPADTRCPRGTRHWLARRPVVGHLHVRPALQRDMARLARLQSRSATGLVFAGGGARGLAHLGVLQELAARGIEVDVIGGTSIGSVMAALAAFDRPLDEIMAVARRAFRGNPTGDYNLVPLLSLIRGRRLKQVIDTATRQLVGDVVDAEDLWKPFFAVASNYSLACEQVLSTGPLTKVLMASTAIPGALPPVLMDGDLLCDGGSFNNFPVDVMHGLHGVGRVIGVDLSVRTRRRFTLEDLPGGWALLLDRLRPRASRRYRFPSLMAYLMNVTVMYSASRQREARRMTDLHLSPPLERVGMLQWHRFDSIVAQGRAHAAQVLDAMGPEGLAPYRHGQAQAPQPSVAEAAPGGGPTLQMGAAT